MGSTSGISVPNSIPTIYIFLGKDSQLRDLEAAKFLHIVVLCFIFQRMRAPFTCLQNPSMCVYCWWAVTKIHGINKIHGMHLGRVSHSSSINQRVLTLPAGLTYREQLAQGSLLAEISAAGVWGVKIQIRSDETSHSLGYPKEMASLGSQLAALAFPARNPSPNRSLGDVLSLALESGAPVPGTFGFIQTSCSHSDQAAGQTTPPQHSKCKTKRNVKGKRSCFNWK